MRTQRGKRLPQRPGARQLMGVDRQPSVPLPTVGRPEGADPEPELA